AADARDRLVGVGPQLFAQVDRSVDRAVLDPEHLGRAQVLRGQVREHAIALAGADRDGDPALGRDPLVGEQRAEARDRAAPHVDDERCGEDTGQLHGGLRVLTANRSYPGDYRVFNSPGSQTAGRDLAGAAEVVVVVDLYPLDLADGRHPDEGAAVGEFLVAVLVVQRGVPAPGRLEGVGERGRGGRVDERGADVLAVRLRGVHQLGDPG